MTKAAKGAQDARLALPTILAFSATSLPITAIVVAVTVHLPAYFAASIGVALGVVAAAFATVRMIDVPIEPALGVLMDRTRTRFGRYRVWTVVGAPLLMIGLLALLVAREGVGVSYLIGWLLVMYLGVSILTLSHAAWASTLAKSYNERARIYGIMAAVGILGALTVLMIPNVMESIGYSDAEGVRAMVWFIIILAPVAAGLVVWRTPETIAPEAPGKRFRLRDYVELIARPSMARILAADLCLSLGPGWMSAMFLFFNRDRMGFTTGQANILLAIYILAGLVGAPGMAWLATKIGKHRAVILATTIYSLTLFSLAFLPRGILVASMPTMFLTGFLAAGFNVLTRAMTADVADEIRLEQGKERSGLLYALTTLTTKIALAASIVLTFSVLARVGYDPKIGSGNTPEAITGLMLTFISGPIVFVMLGGACLLGYKLTAERAADVRRQLEERDALYAGGPTIESIGSEPGQVAPLRP